MLRKNAENTTLRPLCPKKSPNLPNRPKSQNTEHQLCFPPSLLPRPTASPLGLIPSLSSTILLTFSLYDQSLHALARLCRRKTPRTLPPAFLRARYRSYGLLLSVFRVLSGLDLNPEFAIGLV
ncbi:hypothetical protein SLA2020_117740 [Shorea laevis]